MKDLHHQAVENPINNFCNSSRRSRWFPFTSHLFVKLTRQEGCYVFREEHHQETMLRAGWYEGRKAEGAEKRGIVRG